MNDLSQGDFAVISESAIAIKLTMRSKIPSSSPDYNSIYTKFRQNIYADLFEEVIGKILLEKKLIKLIVFEPKSEVILKWIN